jgi:DNA-directed RNA polymerase II subunit RPB1
MNDPQLSVVSGVQYGIMSSTEIGRSSVGEIQTTQLYKLSVANRNGLMSTLMGSYTQNDRCQTCGNSWYAEYPCPGHFAHIRLDCPVVNIEFSKQVVKILSSVCFFCSRLLIGKEHTSYLGIMKIMNIKRRLTAIHHITQRIGICHTTGGGCGGVQPEYTYGDRGLRVLFSNTPDREVSMVKIFQVLHFISDTDIVFLGMDPVHARPASMLWCNLLVPPPIIRPPSKVAGFCMKEDDLTIRLKGIFKLNEQLKKLEGNVSVAFVKDKAKTDKYIELQQCIASYQNNKRGKTSGDEYGADRKSIRTRFAPPSAKKGRLRHDIFGKRQNFSARTVITGDPNLRVDEVGVPIIMCLTLTYPEHAQAFNIQRLTRAVQNGPMVHPGANYIIRDSHTYNLTYAKGMLPLQRGDIVVRHLVDGDYVLMNRQPSLHKMSLMCHRVKVVPGKTFTLHIATTPAYNADFDGDEMNLTVLRDERTRAEGEAIMSVKANIIKDGRPIIQFVQHAVLAVYRMTAVYTSITYHEFMNYAFVAGYDGPTIEKRSYNSIDVLSLVLPDGLWINERGVQIENGCIVQTVPITKSLINNLILYRIWITLGVQAAYDFINRIHSLTHVYLNTHGTTFHIADCQFEHISEIPNIRKRCIQYTNVASLDMTLSEDEREGRICNVHAAARDAIGSLIVQSVDERTRGRKYYRNGLHEITHSGAKGNVSNLIQIAGMIGQQFNNDMTRMVPGTVHLNQDTAGESNGMIHSSFYKGMSSIDMFYHLCGSRDGLVDTAVKVSETGYLQRRLVKSMEDIITHQDGSTRHCDGRIIQVQYGCDGFDPDRLETCKVSLATYTYQDIIERFYILPEHVRARMTPDAQARWVYQSHEFTDCIQREIIRLIHLSDAIRQVNECKPVNIWMFTSFKRRMDGARRTNQYTTTDITPMEVYRRVNTFWDTIIHSLYPDTIMHTAGFFEHCNTRVLWENLNSGGLETFMSVLEHDLMRAKIASGTTVGIIAGQNCIEPLTQMTLNRFHVSGQMSSLVNGVQRMKDIMNATKQPKDTFMTIKIKPGIDRDQFGRKCIAQSIHMFSEYHFISDITDLSWSAISIWETMTQVQRQDICTLTIVIKQKALKEHNTRLDQIMLRISEVCGHYDIMTYSTVNNSPMIHIHIHELHPLYISSAQSFGRTGKTETCEKAVVTIYEKLISTIILFGIPGIESYFKDPLDKNVICTNGSAFAHILQDPSVISSQSFTSNLHETLELLGIDATNASIKHQWAEVMNANHADVGIRHIQLIVDLMTCNGVIAPMTYQGICTENVPVIKQASFEKTVDSFVYGATRGKRDGIDDSMSSICWNRIMKSGSGKVHIFTETDNIPMTIRTYFDNMFHTTSRQSNPRKRHIRPPTHNRQKKKTKRHKPTFIPHILPYASASFEPWDFL